MVSLCSPNFDEIRTLAMEDKYSGLTVVPEERHLTLPWYRLGSVCSGISKLLTKSLYHYKTSFQGVPMAFGNVQMLSESQTAAIIEDQPCMHIDIKSEFVVFFPTVGGYFKAKIACLTDRIIMATLYDWISIIAKRGSSDPPDLAEGQMRVFRVNDYSAQNKFFRMDGDIVSEEEINSLPGPLPMSNNRFLAAFRERKPYDDVLINEENSYDSFAYLKSVPLNRKRIFKEEEDEEPPPEEVSPETEAALNEIFDSAKKKTKKKRKTLNLDLLPNLESFTTELPEQAGPSTSQASNEGAATEKNESERKKEKVLTFPVKSEVPDEDFVDSVISETESEKKRKKRKKKKRDRFEG